MSSVVSRRIDHTLSLLRFLSRRTVWLTYDSQTWYVLRPTFSLNFDGDG